MLTKIFWRLLEDIPVVIAMIGILFLIGVEIERDTSMAIYLLLVALASATVIGFVHGVLKDDR